ncbi:MAG: hypothetical protein NTV94_10475, partial [Planctomycetota bacterium]|nr:hypothetical protein [Planctomycetota bacterium]
MAELDRRVLLGAAGVLGAAAMARVAAAGPVDPPAGPVAPTAGPEPRTPIDARNTPGDSTCKFKITSPGSYFLSGDLVGASGKHGICIALTTPGPVHIDLRGFSLRGVAGALNGID